MKFKFIKLSNFIYYGHYLIQNLISISRNMDIVFHRNCLDGAYSAYLMYLFCKTLTVKGYQQFVQHLKSHQTNELKYFYSEQNLVNQCSELKQQFFHTKTEITFHSVSMYAGDLFPIMPSAVGNILFLLDISPSTKQLMINMSQRFTYVVIIDHHTTFSNCLDFIKHNNLKNVFYLWDQSKCAVQLVEEYLFRGFGFPKNFPKKFQQELAQQIQYVSNNDLKLKQNKISKQFVLGFYYFQIELSHQNPLLFKRIWSLNLEIIFEKGSRLYKDHLQCLVKQVQTCQIFKIIKSKFKDLTFLASCNTDRGLTSDLGSLLAYLSVKNKYSNLGMIYKKGSNDSRISFRSYQFVESEPKALKVSQSFGGGGHVCAAGCYIDKNTFKNHFKLQGHFKPPIKITTEQIEAILFNKGT